MKVTIEQRRNRVYQFDTQLTDGQSTVIYGALIKRGITAAVGSDHVVLDGKPDNATVVDQLVMAAICESIADIDVSYA